MTSPHVSLWSGFAILALLLGVLPSRAADTVKPTADEMAEARRFVAAKFLARASAHRPPFSFIYNGRPSSEFLATWKVDRKSKKIDEHRTAHTVVYSDPAGGLSVRCEAVEYDDYPTVEWTLYFKNTGAADTPILENIQSLDVRVQRGGDGEFLLHHNVGSPHDGTDYAPRETLLPAGRRTSALRRPAVDRLGPICPISIWSGARTRD